MCLFKKILAINVLILPLALVHAQEHGEMLRFNNAPNLDLKLTRNLMKAISDSVVFQSVESKKSAEPFNRILFNGMLSDTNLVLQISYEKQNGQWSDWHKAYMRIFKNGRFWAKLDLEAGSTQSIKYRFIDRGIKAPARIEIYAVEGLDIKSETKSSALPQPAPTTDRIRFAQIDTIPKPPLITRTEWGANPPIGIYVPHAPFRFAQHHTAGRRVATLSEGIAEQKFIQDFHQNGRGWQDIGYHFTVDDSGRIYEGVPPDFRGTHVGGNNTGNIGISYMGNFEIEGEFPTLKALENIIAMWSWLSFEYGVNPDSLFGHRDYTATACPGKNFYPELSDLRNGIRQQIGFGAPYVVNPLPQPFTQEIPPSTAILLSIRDEDEGVDVNTIVVQVNNEVIMPSITGSETEYQVFYQPGEPFPSSQNVTVEIAATDLANPPNSMQYSYQFTIKVEALHTEIVTSSTMRNAELEILGDWEVDLSDVNLTDLTDGQRLIAIDNDSSHVARIFPSVPETGDYKIYLASNNTFLGESAHYRYVNADGSAHPHFAEYNSVYFRKWGLLSPTPVHFDSQDGTGGFIELSGFSNLPTRLVLDAFRLEKVDRLDAPTAPTLKWVKLINTSPNEIAVAWYPTLEGDIQGYRLFMSEDGRTWDDPIVDEEILTADAHEYVVTYDGIGSTIYFRVLAVDTNKIEIEGELSQPLLSPPTDIYGVGLNRIATILIVDNFDRLASWRLPNHPFVRSHGEALGANGYGFDSCTETALQNGEIALDDYEVVIYFCGDDSRADESLAAADQFRLLHYLESGGKLFISGSEIGYDFDATTATERERYESLLKARYVGDISGSNRVLGANGTVFEGLEFVYGTMNTEDTYIEDFPDYILPDGGSEVALNYDNLRIAGVQFTGKYGSSDKDAQLVYLGFTFETINTPEDRAALMARAMRYFGLPTSVADRRPEVPERFELMQNYPNPFNPTTTINYTIPSQSQNNSIIKLEIFNTLGQRIRTLVEEKQIAGSYSKQWHGKDDAGVQVASGLYMYRLTAGDFVESKKMIFLK